MLNKFESFQKYCVRWILSEEFLRYNTYETYIQKCREVKLLPLSSLFAFNDIILFHKIIYELIPIKLPNYLSFYNGSTRLRSSHLDSLSIVSSLQPSRFNEVYLKKSFYYRTHTEWNALPYDIRNISNSVQFKTALDKHFWKHILDSDETDFDEFDFVGD